ncbi:YgaP family membrane protein [Roseixanthobacter glucoisosaccharinicivorans]|uniref:YgaP family membrane protein n=1 Tax=Roseixanthobacter glucoisosaccharinicivorans TaxID=3119923 RepID=UPI003729E769
MVNVGTVDRAVRALAGIILLLLPFLPAVATALAGLGAWIWILSAIGAVLLLTSVFRFCPAYTLLGIRTCATK